MSFVESGKGRFTYSASFAGPHTLSDEDVALIKTQGLHNIKKIYKATDPSKIEDVLFGDIISDNCLEKEGVKLDNNTFGI